MFLVQSHRTASQSNPFGTGFGLLGERLGQCNPPPLIPPLESHEIHPRC